MASSLFSSPIPTPKGTEFAILGDANGNVISATNPPVAASSSLPYGADYASYNYTGAFVTSILFKSGGSGGTLLATHTLANDGTNYTSLTKT